MRLSDALREHIDAGFAGLWVHTQEPDEAIKEIVALAGAEGYRIHGLGDDGTAKRLHGSAVENLREFFERFQGLSLHSSAELDALVAKAEAVLNTASNGIAAPITAEDLKDSAMLRATVKEKLASVSAQLDQMLSASPRRTITRRPMAAQPKEDVA